MELKDIIIVNIDGIGELRTSIGQSEKKVKNSAQEFVSMPLEGTFSHVGTKEFSIEQSEGEPVKVVSLGLYTKKGEFVSENALIAQNLLKELVQIKTGVRKNKYCLKSERLTNLNHLGHSQNARMVALQGKTFKATKLDDCRVYKSEFLDSVKFDLVCSDSASATALKSAMDKTETKSLYKFEVAE